jgi:hypothetical protein
VDSRIIELDVTVAVAARPDGGIRVTSDDVPGLLLGGADRERVWSVVGPSVERLLRANRGLDVLSVRGPMTPPPAGDVPMRVEHLTVEYRAAA